MYPFKCWWEAVCNKTPLVERPPARIKAPTIVDPLDSPEESGPAPMDRFFRTESCQLQRLHLAGLTEESCPLHTGPSS